MYCMYIFTFISVVCTGFDIKETALSYRQPQFGTSQMLKSEHARPKGPSRGSNHQRNV